MHGQRVLESGADFLVTSVGAFTDTALFDRLLAAAKANGARLILPSGGIGALDILSSAAVGGLDSVTVTVRKDPSAWKGTVAETLVDLDGDGTLEFLDATSGGALCAYRHDGTLLPSFNGGRCWQLPPTFYAHPEAPGFKSGAVPPVNGGLRTPSVADLDGDFEPDLVLVAGDGRIFVLRPDGTVRLSLGIDPANSTRDKRNGRDHPKRGVLGAAVLADLDVERRVRRGVGGGAGEVPERADDLVDVDAQVAGAGAFLRNAKSSQALARSLAHQTLFDSSIRSGRMTGNMKT